MASRSSETLLVFITLIVASVLLWFAVRYIAEGPTDHATGQTHVDRSPPKAFSPPPAPVVVAGTPAPIESTPELTEVLPLSTVEKLRKYRGVESYAEPREVATMNNFLWSVYPYLCIVLFFTVPIIRMVTRPFSWSTRASGLFGRQLLGAASLMLHWGLTLVLIGHIVGLLGGVLGMQSAIGFFYWTGLFGGVLVLVGSVVALYRRYTSPQVRAMSQPEDYVVHLFIISIVSLALYQVFVHRHFRHRLWRLLLGGQFVDLLTPTGIDGFIESHHQIPCSDRPDLLWVFPVHQTGSLLDFPHQLFRPPPTLHADSTLSLPTPLGTRLPQR